MADPTKNSTTRSSRKVANSLLSLSSAAVLAIYAAGYERTRTAADELEAASAQRRPVVPSPQRTAPADPPAIQAPPLAATIESGAVGVPTVMPAPPPEAAPMAAVASTTPATSAAPAPVSVAMADTVAKPLPPLVKENNAPGLSTAAAPSPAPTAAAVAASTPVSAAAPVAAAAPMPKYKDGTFRAWGRSRHGDIFSFVVVENGRIVHSGVDKCRTRWSCDLVSHLGPQVVQRQNAEVDYVSGATESGNAFYYGVLEALNMAQGLSPVDPVNEIK